MDASLYATACNTEFHYTDVIQWRADYGFKGTMIPFLHRLGILPYTCTTYHGQVNTMIATGITAKLGIKLSRHMINPLQHNCYPFHPRYSKFSYSKDFLFK